MPLSRVVESFDFRASLFDVVIIDEASQCDVMALVALFLGRNVVVVGDHEQVSPAAVGQDLTLVQHLIDEHLHGIPNAVLYDGQMSVYDLARQSFGGTILLVEHFRCVPEIIQFSNWLSYDGKVRPLRDASLVKLKPHILAYRVEGARSKGKVNPKEALAVASLLVAATEQPEYAHKTFGVISMVGEDQALEIERLLRSHLSPKEYDQRRTLCGTAAQFQGDERDVMFLSMVDTAEDGPLALREQPMFKQRFNVAASRARDQMWVVHSMDPRTDVKPGDLRRRLIEHAMDPTAIIRSLERAEQRVESELEKAVMRRLLAAGYRVHPQWRVGHYRIDLVVEGGGRRLAIECDGDRSHPIEKLSEDMARQAVLERLGWIFERVRGSQFFRDPEAALKPVFDRLESLGIPPQGSSALQPIEQGSSGSLRERIVRRAAELRRDWSGSRGIDNPDDTNDVSHRENAIEVTRDSLKETQPGTGNSPGDVAIGSQPHGKGKDPQSFGSGGVTPMRGPSMKYELTFTIEKVTKNTVRYQEEGNSPKVGYLYVQKQALPSPHPQRLKVTIEAE
jgi:very-short-patch-repair endonuclease